MSQTVVEKRRGYILRGRVDSERVTYSCRTASTFWKGWVDSGSVAYSCEKKGGGYIMGGRGKFWEYRL